MIPEQAALKQPVTNILVKCDFSKAPAPEGVGACFLIYNFINRNFEIEYSQSVPIS